MGRLLSHPKRRQKKCPSSFRYQLFSSQNWPQKMWGKAKEANPVVSLGVSFGGNFYAMSVPKKPIPPTCTYPWCTGGSQWLRLGNLSLHHFRFNLEHHGSVPWWETTDRSSIEKRWKIIDSIRGKKPPRYFLKWNSEGKEPPRH